MTDKPHTLAKPADWLHHRGDPHVFHSRAPDAPASPDPEATLRCVLCAHGWAIAEHPYRQQAHHRHPASGALYRCPTFAVVPELGQRPTMGVEPEATQTPLERVMDALFGTGP